MNIQDIRPGSHIHFIGIGGISMSGIAELMHTRGYVISGSDLTRSAVTEHLESLGIRISYPQAASNIVPGIDLVVYTAAIHPDNPEFAAAKAAGLPLYERSTMLGAIMHGYQNAINVAGTHGKTTTTSMISAIYLAADMDPTISVGGIMPGIHGNMRIGQSENFIVEACEYTDSFLEFYPTKAVILNIEPEHLDYFKDLAAERASFRRFASLVPENGVIVINKGIEHYEELLPEAGPRVITYGLEPDADYTAENITFDAFGRGSFDLITCGENRGRINLGVVGIHNVSNALAAIAIAEADGISLEQIRTGLSSFSGTDRRFQVKGTWHGVTIIDDYAHHPTEIAATLAAARKVDHKRLIVAFQPHLYSRTKNFLSDFIHVLSEADILLLADIYAAREKDPGDISSKDIADGVLALGREAHYLGSFENIENFLINNASEGDLLITMGAGNIVNVGESLLKKP